MAYLYAYSSTYRALINAMRRSPLIGGLFIVGTTAGGVMAYKGADMATRGKMNESETELKRRLETDVEFQRYAENSERALATMFREQLGKGADENEKYLKDKQQMKLPTVQWHPKVKKEEDKKD